VASFDELNPGPVTASLVVSKDGETVSELGSSKGLGNQTDLQLLKWFRSRSQIVLTSGKTAFAENYRYPSSAELAILSRSERKYSSLENDLSRVRFLADQASYVSAVETLHSQGFQRIHTEFGLEGAGSARLEETSADAVRHCFNVDIDDMEEFKLASISTAEQSDGMTVTCSPPISRRREVKSN
jgi:riboflavin biosynthesis pyrimidine reductase